MFEFRISFLNPGGLNDKFILMSDHLNGAHRTCGTTRRAGRETGAEGETGAKRFLAIALFTAKKTPRKWEIPV